MCSDATGEELDAVCTMTGARYLELGLELGLTKTEIDVYEMDHRYCQPITRHILHSWIKRTESKAIWEVLGDALYEIGVGVQFIIDDICNKA